MSSLKSSSEDVKHCVQHDMATIGILCLILTDMQSHMGDQPSEHRVNVVLWARDFRRLIRL